MLTFWPMSAHMLWNLYWGYHVYCSLELFFKCLKSLEKLFGSILCRTSMTIAWWHHCHNIWQAEDKPVWFFQPQVYHSVFSSITMKKDITALRYDLSEIHLWWLAYCHGNYNRSTKGYPWHILWRILTRHETVWQQENNSIATL